MVKRGLEPSSYPRGIHMGSRGAPDFTEMLLGHPRKEGDAQQAASAIGTDLLLSVHMLRPHVRFCLKK